MKILYLSNHLNVGGITSYIFSLARGFKSRGHTVYVASSCGDCLPRFNEEGIEFISIPIKTKSEVDPRILWSAFKLRKFIKENSIEIIHANTRVTQVLGCLLERLSGEPYVCTCHGFFKKRFFRRLFPCWGQKVIAISQQVAEHLRRDFKVGDSRISIIHHGIDLDRFRVFAAADKEEAREKFSLGSAPVIGIIARLSDVKGHSYLIEAVKIVLEKIPAVRLFLVGEGREERRLRRLIKRLGMEKNVSFAPAVKDTLQALAAMDVFVMPSLQEGLGLSLMEAMACGLAVVGSDVGGIKTLIQDKYSGLLVPPARPRELAQAILELLEDKRKAQDLGERARIFIHQNFSQAEMLGKTEKVYLECLNAKD